MMRMIAMVLAIGVTALPLIEGRDRFDLDKSEPDHMYLDNPWGGSPIVASEIGKTPQAMGDPETMNPVYGTCAMPGVVPSECTPDCAFNCDTPECSLNCFCGCNNEEKAMHAQMLAQYEQTAQVLAARDNVYESAPAFDGDARFWKRSRHVISRDKRTASAANALKFQEATEKRKLSPRFKMHQLLIATQRKAKLIRKQARAGKRPIIDKQGQRISATRDPLADADGFSWDKFHAVNAYWVRGGSKRDNSPYADEVGKMNNVFDPAEDLDNEGENEDYSAVWNRKRSNVPAWRQRHGDHWWTHFLHGYAAGTTPNPFGTHQNEHERGWY